MEREVSLPLGGVRGGAYDAFDVLFMEEASRLTSITQMPYSLLNQRRRYLQLNRKSFRPQTLP